LGIKNYGLIPFYLSPLLRGFLGQAPSELAPAHLRRGSLELDQTRCRVL